MMNRKQAAIAAACGMICAVTAVGGTFAYLTDKEEITNTFTVGKVDIEETEPDWDPEKGEDLVPGQEVEKNPMLTNVGKNDAYVYMSVTIPVATVVTANEDGTLNNNGEAAATELFTMNELDENWIQMSVETDADGNKVYTYLYDQILAPEQSTDPLFTSVTFVNIIEGQIDADAVLEIPVRSYAIQTLNTAGEDDATVEAQARTAWEKYVNQNTAAVTD